MLVPFTVPFTACGIVFHDLTKKNTPVREFASAECQAMIQLSAFLLDALSWYWHCKVRGLPDSFVREQYPGPLPRTREELEQFSEYWAFINRMRKVAIAIGFRRLPHYGIAAEFQRMSSWCIEAGSRQLRSELKTYVYH